MIETRAKFTISESGEILSQNEISYDFLEAKVGDLFSKCMPECEQERFFAAMKKAGESESGTSNVSLNVHKFDGTEAWVYLEIEKRAVGEAVSFDIYMLDILGLVAEVEKLNYIKRVQDNYLDMLDEILLSYDSRSGIIQLCTIKDMHKVILYENKLSVWAEEILENSVAEGYEDIFSDYVQHIREGHDDISEIVLNKFLHIQGKKIWTVQCRQITVNRVKRLVIGTIREKRSGSQSAALGINYSKDPNLNILTQKAITEYAKRAFGTSQGKRIYLVLMDMDDFSNVNDSLGHLFGDEVLATTAKIISEAVRDCGIVGRVGGDEFLIVLENGTELTELRNTLRTIRTNIEWTFRDICNDVRVTCTMGAASYPYEGEAFEEVYQVAAKMLQRGKEKGKNRYIIYRPEIHGTDVNNLQNGSDMSEELLQGDTVGILHRILGEYLTAQTMTNEMMLSQVGIGFRLDEILLVYDHSTVAFRWTKNGITNLINTIKPLILPVPFIQSFGGKRYRVIESIEEIEAFPEVQRVMTEKGIRQMIIYKFGEENISPSYVAFGKSNDEIPWSDYDILALTIVAKTLELTVENR